MDPNAIAGSRKNHGNLHDQTPSAPLISYPDQPPWSAFLVCVPGLRSWSAFQVRPLVRKSAHFTDNPPVLNCAPKVGHKKIIMKNEKYPTKVAAVRMLASGKSASQVCRELHIGPNSLRLWYQQYSQGGELSLLAKPHAHQKSFEEKAMIIEDIVNNGLSLTAASIKYELAHETLRGWYLSYKSHGLEGLRRKNEATMSKKKRTYTEDELDELERLRLRNEWLEAENALLKKVRALVEEREARQRGTGRKPSKN